MKCDNIIIQEEENAQRAKTYDACTDHPKWEECHKESEQRAMVGQQ